MDSRDVFHDILINLTLRYNFEAMKRISVFFLIFLFFFFTNNAFAQNSAISDYTENLVNDFVTERVILKSEDDFNAVSPIKNMLEESLLHLNENAIDYEQEKAILEGMYFMEIYVHSLRFVSDSTELVNELKSRMDKMTAVVSAREIKKLSKWAYVFAGDLTSFYMTRSLQATLFYGFKVRDFYEKALKIDDLCTSANISLGNWTFYAPAVFGGKSKSEELFLRAIKGAHSDGEKFIAYEYISQLYFEKKDYKKSGEYMALAKSLNIGTKELNLIENCNKLGYSYYQYMRNASGIDEAVSSAENDR